LAHDYYQMTTQSFTEALELLTYEQAARYCQVSKRSIQAAASAREFAVTYVTVRRPRIVRADLERWIARKKRRAAL
jgi:excisionase family DNA binding protein